MKISTTHQKFADRLNDQTALEYPERFLGPNWKNVLNFWIYLDTLSYEDRELISERYRALYDIDTLWCLAWRAAVDTIGYGYSWVAHEVTPFDRSLTCELIGSHKLKTLTFLPLFYQSETFK